MHARLLARRSIRYIHRHLKIKRRTPANLDARGERAGARRCVPPPWEVEPHTPAPWSLLIKKPSKTKKPELMLVVDRYTTSNHCRFKILLHCQILNQHKQTSRDIKINKTAVIGCSHHYEQFPYCTCNRSLYRSIHA